MTMLRSLAEYPALSTFATIANNRIKAFKMDSFIEIFFKKTALCLRQG